MYCTQWHITNNQDKGYLNPVLIADSKGHHDNYNIWFTCIKCTTRMTKIIRISCAMNPGRIPSIFQSDFEVFTQATECFHIIERIPRTSTLCLKKPRLENFLIHSLHYRMENDLHLLKTCKSHFLWLLSSQSNSCEFKTL